MIKQRQNCITDLTPAGIDRLVEALGQPSYRAGQLRHWTYRRLAVSFGEMTDLPRPFRQRLEQQAGLHCLEPVHETKGRDGTVKVLFSLADGKTIESALLCHPAGSRERYTACVSTQVGCAIGCPFCATGQQGFERNLTAGEIIDQVLHLARYPGVQGDGQRDNADRTTPLNLVFMGMGEPLNNYSALVQAIRVLNAPSCFGLAARNMVVSTAGLVPRIERLGREKLQVGLAVSLHASDNRLRDRLVPVNRRYPLEQLIPACHSYSEMTGRRLSFEYVLFDGINDSRQQARSLARLLDGLDCHVNLIAANDTADPAFRTPPGPAVLAFQEELARRRITATIRHPRGRDILAGCGQLRSQYSGRQYPVPAPKDGPLP